MVLPPCINSSDIYSFNGQNHRILNVGPKPTKWTGDTPLSAFKMDIILHYRATEFPAKNGE